MGRFKIWILIGGIAAGYYGWKEWRLAGVVKSDPQTLTCEALGRDGYGDNAHVKLTDFYVAASDFVYEEKRKSKEWGNVWIPVVPSDGEYVALLKTLPEDAKEIPPAKDFRVILQSEHVKSQSGLGMLYDASTLRGVVINEVDSLNSETRKLLKDSYPQVDLDKCWILEHRRKVKSAGASLGILALGVGLIGLSIFLFVRGAKGS